MHTKIIFGHIVVNTLTAIFENNNAHLRALGSTRYFHHSLSLRENCHHPIMHFISVVTSDTLCGRAIHVFGQILFVSLHLELGALSKQSARMLYSSKTISFT